MSEITLSEPDMQTPELEAPAHEAGCGDIETWLGDAQTSARAVVADWLDALDREVAAPMREAFARAGEAVAGCEGDEAYHHALREHVLGELHDTLRGLQLGQAPHAHAALAEMDLERLLEAAPEGLERLEPAELYASAPGDPVAWRVGKARERTRRRLAEMRRRTADAVRRMGRGEPAPAPERVQRVPARVLLTHHLRTRLPAALQDAAQRTVQTFARPIAALERELTERVHEALAGHATADDVAELSAFLRAQGEAISLDDVREAAHLQVDAAHAGLVADADRSGSFMLDAAARAAAARVAFLPAPREAWMHWHARALDRFALSDALLDWHVAAAGIEAETAARVRERALEPTRTLLQEGAGALRALADEAEAAFDGGQVGPERVRELLAQALEIVGAGVAEPWAEAAYERQARQAAEEEAARLMTALGALPEMLRLNALQTDDAARVEPAPGERMVPLRRVAEQAYDAILAEQLRTAGQPAADAIGAARGDVEGVPSVLSFNLESALEELQRTPDDDEVGETPQASARELAVGGLRRSAQALDAARQRVDDAEQAFEEQLDVLYGRGFARLRERLEVEERLRERLLDVQAGVAERARALYRHAAKQTHAARVVAERYGRIGRSRLMDLLRRGQAVAGLTEADDADRLATLEALAGARTLLSHLPVVYRRLFAFQPVSDGALLVGRDADLARVRRHLEQWHRGVTNSLVLTGAHGSGLTSFVTVVRETLLREADVSVVTLETRLTDEAAFAARMAEALGVPDAPDTLDALAERIVAAPRPPRTQVCVVEHLEHLYLRCVGGTDLVEAVLTFFSRTDGRVLWIGTSSAFAWQVVARAEPTASVLVERYALTPLGRESIEALVMRRHQRSGLPLVFEPPPRSESPLLHRRLRRARSDEERQALVRRDFFDRLHRVGGQNIMLTLLYWLRSVRLDEQAGTLHVQPLQSLHFGFLDALDLPTAFTLKSLLDHGTLTVGEHAALFRQAPRESLQQFEVLGNLLLIMPAGDEPDDAPIREDVRYALRPLALQPIVEFLRTRNVVH